jgi:hypothetical protein
LLGFCALVAAILALPLGARMLHIPSHKQRLGTAPDRAGPYSFIQREVFEESGDIDLLLVGDSVIWVGLDARALEEGLSTALGHAIRVRTLAWNWTGDDLPYYVLRDLLERRAVKHVVMRLRAPDRSGGQPHPTSYRWLFGCQHDPVMASLPPSLRLVGYGIEMVGGPRNLLSLLRPDLQGSSPYADMLGSYLVRVGPGGQLFPAVQTQAPRLGSSAIVTSTTAQGRLQIDPSPPSDYQRGYLAGTRDLLLRHHAHVSLLRFPDQQETRLNTLSIAGYQPAILGGNATILAPEPAVLFAGMGDSEVDALYYFGGSHFNANGARFFTQALLPTLIDLQRQIEAGDHGN